MGRSYGDAAQLKKSKVISLKAFDSIFLDQKEELLELVLV